HTKEETMPSRRDFVKTAARATAGMFVMGRGFLDAAVLSRQAAAAKRRQVLIGGRRIKVVDVHGHFVIPEELDLIKDTNLAGNIKNNLNGPLVLGPARLQDLDERGIDVQALSHQGAWWYAIDRDLARRLVKVQNEKLAA